MMTKQEIEIQFFSIKDIEKTASSPIIAYYEPAIIQ